MRKVTVVLLLVTVGLAACGSVDDTSVDPTVADFDFSEQVSLGWTVQYGPHAWWHRFGPEWTRHPGQHGPLGLGSELSVQLYLPGEHCRLDIELSTLPILARAGQDAQLLLDGQSLGSWRLPHDEQILEISVPLSAVPTAGLSRLDFLLTRNMNDFDDPPAWAEGRPISVRLHRLAVITLDDDDATDWMGRVENLTDDDSYDLVVLPARPSSDTVPDRQRPDVLMILLDAARPDHFGCYGYSRDTTPRMDSLAADGATFSEVFANSPYTIASMPTILTGRHWRDHGVLAVEHALSDSFVTLAEVLQADGYRTIAISGTPRMSPGPNLDQGFDEFMLAYEHPDDGPDTRHELPERLLRTRSAHGFGDDPVFCFVHVVPPHEPYRPGPEHDLWSDPDYDGEFDGSYHQLMALIRGDLAWDEADRQELLDLYDGNLHRADASVGRMVNDWRSLKRDRELMVVILADHGEAFAEHGRFGHNSTVYDEMSRIPFIVYPARLAPSLMAAQDHLLDATDLMPLLLHALGTPLPDRTAWPRRFLRLLEDPTSPRGEVIMKATGLQKGVRTDRYLALTNDWQLQELYDMQADPAARENLRLRYPELYSRLIGGMMKMLQNHGQRVDTEESDLTDQDRRVLRSLGYL